MEPFIRLTAIAVPLDHANVDTDRIVPARFLRKPRTDGYGKFLFYDVRFNADGAELPDFILNRAPYRDARILVADLNFGCGSSREGAVWALFDYGFRSVIAPSFGDIFFNNCLKIGLLPVVLREDIVAGLRAQLRREPGARISIDLAAQTLVGPDGVQHRVEINPFHKHCLLNGLDEIGLTLEHGDAILAFEARSKAERPWLW
jgi:3-isopropylmalate/(R)-2-methylmalate dehydratase small subunit